MPLIAIDDISPEALAAALRSLEEREPPLVAAAQVAELAARLTPVTSTGKETEELAVYRRRGEVLVAAIERAVEAALATLPAEPDARQRTLHRLYTIVEPLASPAPGRWHSGDLLPVRYEIARRLEGGR